MKITTIFYSYSGITRSIAEKIKESCGGDLIEVKTNEQYSAAKAYSIGCYRALKGICDEIQPSIIDIFETDLIIIGTPVWAYRATPAINGAVETLTNCSGKIVILFATCGSHANDTLSILEENLTAKGMIVGGKFVFNKNDVQDEDKINNLINAIKKHRN